MGKKTQELMLPPNPWRSQTSEKKPALKGLDLASVLIGSIVLLFALYYSDQNPGHNGMAGFFCLMYGITFFVISLAVGLLFYLTGRSEWGKIKDWYISIPADPKMFRALDAAVIAHLRSRNYGVSCPRDAHDKAWKDPVSKDIYYSEYLIKNPNGPEFGVRLILYETDKSGAEPRRSGALQLLYVTGGNIEPAWELANELVRILRKAGALQDRKEN